MPSGNHQQRRIDQSNINLRSKSKSTTSRKLTALARCKQIQANPSNVAEILLRERLIFSVEG